jgi:hypothetical protein
LLFENRSWSAKAKIDRSNSKCRSLRCLSDTGFKKY